MKHRNQPLILIAVASLLVLGAISILLQRPARRWLGFQTPTPLPSQTLTDSPTPWVVTQEITATPMPSAVLAQAQRTPTVTKLVFTKVPAPRVTEPEAFEYMENCVTIEEGLPEDVKPADELLLYDLELERSRVYDFSVGYYRRSPFELMYWSWYNSDSVPSPDGKWMAYTVKTYNEKGIGAKSRTLEVQNVEGRKLDMSYWMVDWQYILGWTDDQRLILYVPTYSNPAGSVVLLNPFTTEWEVFSPSLPGPVEPTVEGAFPGYIAYNPSITHVVYQPEASDYYMEARKWILYDLSGQQVLWTGTGGYGFLPKWSPDGRRFVFADVIRDNYVNLRVVEQDGKVWIVRNKVGSMDADEVSWSPDGRYLAAYMMLDKNKVLILANIKDQTLTNLCISPGDPWALGPIYWSPDGRFVAFQTEGKTPSWWGGYDTILVDVEQQRAFRFRKNAVPKGWMKKP